MAPWPAQGNEPKAPDRNKTSDNRTVDNLKSKSEPPDDKKLVKGISKDDQSESKKKDVHSLDDGQLKALLDEAIQYKNPKDREGKSKIFRELLQKVEADDSDYSYPVVGIRGSGGRRAIRIREGNKGVPVSERATRSGSLQNIFHAASCSEFDTHHPSGSRKKNKRQGPGSSVSARQREGGSLPSNVNAGWPLESWQSDQTKKKGLFDRDPIQPNHVTVSFGNTAYCNSSSVAVASTQARRQTLKHSASNELPSSKKPNPGELYPLRRHHSSSDQLKPFELNIVKLKNQSESSSMVRKMPQLPKPNECVSFDMSSLNLEIKKLSDSDPSLNFEKKPQTFQNSEKCRITSCEVESENSNNNNQEVFTTRASLEVEPVDSSIELGFNEKRILNGMESVQLSDNYPSVQCIMGDRTRISDASNQGRLSEQPFGLRPHMYRNLNMNMNMNMIVNISSKATTDSPRTDENGNALNVSSLTTRIQKKQKRKLLAQKNTVFSHDIAGYRGNADVDIVVNFIERGKAKNKQLKKLTKGKKNEKKRQSMQKSSSFEDVSQRNIEDLSESSESEKTSTVEKFGINNSTDPAIKDRRKFPDQVFVTTGSKIDLNAEEEEENNSDGEFQIVTKKQRKKKIHNPNPKLVRNYRNSRRSPRRKSTSSVPPSERGGDSDLDSVHSLPVGGAPTVSYADIAAGNSAFFSPKAINEISTFNGNSPEKLDCANAIKNNEIESWCNSVKQHWEKSNENCSNIINNNSNSNNNNNNNINNNNINNNNNNNNNNNLNNKNNKSNVNASNNNSVNGSKTNGINTNNIVQNTNNLNVNQININNFSDLKNCSRHESRKNNLGVEEVNEICDNNVKKFKDLVIVDKSVDSKVVTTNKVIELPLKNEYKKIVSSCDSDQCKTTETKSTDTKKNWNKKKISREDFPSLPVKSENASQHKQNKESSEQNAFGKTKQVSPLSELNKSVEEIKGDGGNQVKTPKRPKSEDEGKHRRSNRSKSVGPNTRPPVILLHDERTKDTSVCEITFGFEINEQLLSSDDSTIVPDDVTTATTMEGINDVISSSYKSSRKSNHDVSKIMNRSSENSVKVDQTLNVNGGIAFNEIKENQNAYINSTNAVLGEIMNSTVSEFFGRQETMPKKYSTGNHPSGDHSGNSIANKYVPPAASVQFNYDKIVSFVGLAWEDVMRNGKIQYYTGDN